MTGTCLRYSIASKVLCHQFLLVVTDVRKVQVQVRKAKAKSGHVAQLCVTMNLFEDYGQNVCKKQLLVCVLS